MRTIIASAALAEHLLAPLAGLTDEIDRQERDDNQRGPERDETDTELLDTLFALELELLVILPTAEDTRPSLPQRDPVRPPRHDPQPPQSEPGLPHPQH